jgi:hypothetical protein
MGMFLVISGYIFCGVCFGYAIAVLHKGTVSRHEQHAAPPVARRIKQGSKQRARSDHEAVLHALRAR